MKSDFRVGPWLVRPNLNVISRNGTTVRLEPKVMEVLLCLSEHPGEAFSKEELLQRVWSDTFVSDDALKHCVSELRRVLADDARAPHIIETIPKRGYRLIAPVQPVDGTQEASSRSPQSRIAEGPERAARRSPFWIWTLATGVAALVATGVIALHLGRSRPRANTNGIPYIRSVAVLPLQNLSDDSAQEYFSEGMTDALITDLAQISSMKVISRTSTARYQHTRKSLPEIARELNVDGVVEGTVQRSGDRVRITAQLIYAPSDKHIWADSYERQMQDVFALERDLAEEISRKIQTQIKTWDSPPLRSRPVRLVAMEAYLQGNYYLNRGTGDVEMRKAEQYFQKAIDADPDYAPAYIGNAYSHYYLLRSTKQDQLIRRTSAEKAVALDPTSSDAHSALGDMMFADWEWAPAEQELQRAIALNPNNAKAHASLCDFFDALAQLNESLTECRIAQQLDPDYDHLSEVMASTGQYDRAIELLLRAIEHHPQDAFLHYFLYRDYALVGMHKEALLQLEESLRLIGHPEIAAQVNTSYIHTGYQGALRQWAKQLEHLHATGEYFLPRLVAEVYAQLGDKDRAFYWLDQGYEQHARIGVYGGLTWILIEHQLDPLRLDPRFKELLRRLGLPDS